MSNLFRITFVIIQISIGGIKQTRLYENFDSHLSVVDPQSTCKYQFVRKKLNSLWKIFNMSACLLPIFNKKLSNEPF